MSVFIPTFLYIKQHSITCLLYFGKTTQDPEKYFGSGTRWLNHVNKHGKEHVINLWYCLFLDEESITKFAKLFSEQNQIVESKSWANLMPENGLTGGPIPKSDETKIKIGRSAYKRQQIKPSKGCNVVINGVLYKSITAASKAFCVSDAAVHYWIKTGRALRQV